MKLLREPLIHFLALGAGLFAVFAVLGGSNSERPDDIVITPNRVRHLARLWENTWRRQPTPQELDGLIEEHVREEIFYREALVLGLDQDDTVVRRRMRQKLEFLFNDLADAAEPTEAELRTYFRKNPEPFRGDTRISFSHVYLNPDRRGASILRDAEELLKRLRQSGDAVDASATGDSSLLERDFTLAPTAELASLFGRDFADRLVKVAVGDWSGPVKSGYGQHLVLVRENLKGQLPDYQDVRDEVRREFNFAHRKASSDAMYQRLRGKYTVVRVPESTEAATQVASTGLNR